MRVSNHGVVTPPSQTKRRARHRHSACVLSVAANLLGCNRPELIGQHDVLPLRPRPFRATAGRPRLCWRRPETAPYSSRHLVALDRRLRPRLPKHLLPQPWRLPPRPEQGKSKTTSRQRIGNIGSLHGLRARSGPPGRGRVIQKLPTKLKISPRRPLEFPSVSLIALAPATPLVGAGLRH